MRAEKKTFVRMQYMDAYGIRQASSCPVVFMDGSVKIPIPVHLNGLLRYQYGIPLQGNNGFSDPG